jgi:hypothetical protein
MVRRPDSDGGAGQGARPGDCQLRDAIGAVLSSAGGRRDLVAGLEEEHLARLGRAVIEFDPREQGWAMSRRAC